MKSSKPKFHTRYNPPPSPGIVFEEPTMTQQHFRDECDINKIVERAIRTGDTTVFTSAHERRRGFGDRTEGSRVGTCSGVPAGAFRC